MSRKSILWTASKITLFLLLALAVRPLEAVEYHIGTTGTNTATDIYYADLEALRIAVSNRATDGLNDGDFITLYGDDHSLTNELYVGYNVSITFRSNDSEQRRTVTPAAGAQTRFIYMDGTGNSRWSKIYFEGIEEMSGFDDRGNTSSGGGIIYAWWNQYIYTQDGKGVTFKDNFSQTGTGGGVVYYWDAIECDFTDSNFINNSTTGAGGALFINASTTLTMTDHTDITIGASDGNVSTFSGNRAGVSSIDGSGGYLNSIDFTGGSDNTANLYIKTEGTGILDMQDPFRTQAGFGGNYYVNIIKTGAGTWKLGGDSVVSGSSGTRIEIQEGTLEFYRGASLSANGANDSFAVKKDARVLIVGENRIQGSTVTFDEGSIFAFDMNFYFTTPPGGGPIPTKDTHMLELAGGLNLNKAAVDILNLPAGDERKGDYTLVLSDKDIQGDDFTLQFNGAIIETVASDRLGYGLRIPDAAKNTLVLHVDDTFNTVLVWNNHDTAHSGQWSYDSVNWRDDYVKHADDAFIPNDTVIFDLNAGGTISLAGIMTVSKDAGRHSGDFGTTERGMRVSGSGNWTFNGGAIADAYSTTSGEVSGPDFLAALIFDGTGTLTLNNTSASTYHDGTYISGGGTIIAKGVDSLGSSAHAGSSTTGRTVANATPTARRVQDEGYGVLFQRNGSARGGGTIIFESGSTFDPDLGLPTDNIWDQRIRVEGGSFGEIRFESTTKAPMVIKANSVYQNYAFDVDPNGGVVNVGNNGEFKAIGNFVFAENTLAPGNGGAIYAGNGTSLTFNGTNSLQGLVFIANEAQNGGAVHLGDNASIALTRVTFQENEATAADGGAVRIGDRGTFTAASSVFQNNVAADRGGAVYAAAGTTMNVNGTAFHSNEADQGGAIYHAGTSGTTPLTLNFENTVFGSITINPNDPDDITDTGNEAEAGGAIYLADGSRVTMTMTGSSGFYANEAATGSGGAINVATATTAFNLTLNNTVFDRNTAQVDGGAIASPNNSNITATNTTFTDNIAKTGHGGAVRVGNGSGLTGWNGVSFQDNKSLQGSGGAVSLGNNSRMTFVEINPIASDFTGNIAAQSGGAISFGNNGLFDATRVAFEDNKASAGTGGAVSMLDNSSFRLGQNVSFTNNEATASHGGAVSLGNNSSFEARRGVAFTENRAGGTGGAIRVGDNTAATTGTASVLAWNATFTRNEADDDGGAIRVGSGHGAEALTIDLHENGSSLKTQFIENTADNSGGAISGGDYVRLLADNAVFQDNTARFDGGAVRLGDGAVVEINSAAFSGNTFGHGTGKGGALYAGNNATINGVGAQFLNNGTAVPENGTMPQTGLYGGAVRVGDEATLDFTSATFTRNIVNAALSQGGAIHAGSLSNITAVSTLFQENSARGDGGAIFAGNGSVLDATRARFFDNTAVNGDGGAIYLTDDTEITLDSAQFKGNTAGSDGGAIYAMDDVEIISGTSVQFTDNTAKVGSGGAIRAGDGANIVLPLGRFIDNTAATDGGAIFAGNDLGIIDISGESATSTAMFTGNKAGGDGGAIRVGDDADELTFDYATFTTNEAGGDGGAIRVGDGAGIISFDSATFTTNTAGGDGGAVRIGSGVLVLAERSAFTQNASEDSGGAMKLGDGTLLSMADSTMTRNEAAGSGGALQAGAGSTVSLVGTRVNVNTAEESGGAFELGTGSALITTGSEFTDNEAALDGGAVFITGTGQDTAFLRFDTTTFRNNSALDGNGGAVYATHTGGLVQSISSRFVANEAAGDGGALYFAETVDLVATNTVFDSNVARSGGAIHAAAGGTMELDGTEFDGNQATAGNGGAVVFGATGVDSSVNGVGSTFTGNTATGNATQGGSGGALAVIDANLDFTDTVFDGNTAAQQGGAIFYETTVAARTLRFAAGAGMTAGFRDNTAGGESSSIHFSGTGAPDDPTVIAMRIETGWNETDGEGVFELLDAMHVDGTNNALGLDITKTGLGTWRLGGIHDLRGTAAASSARIEAGTFDMRNGAALLLTNTDDTFTMTGDTVLIVRGENEIAASTIAMTDELHFDLNGTQSDSDMVALTLTGTVSGNAVGSTGIIRVLEFVQQTGVYNLVKADDKDYLADTAELWYKDIKWENNDRLRDFWDLSVDTDNAILQLELRPWENTDMTWTGSVDNYWNMEKRNWEGVSEGIDVEQFIDGDSVHFGDAGAGTINVSPSDVVVDGMTINSKEDYVFQGGTVTGNVFQKYGTGSLEMKNLFLFDTFEVYGGTITGGLGGNWSFVGDIDFKKGSVFAPSDKFRVDGDISMEGGSGAELVLGKSQAQSSAVMASGTIDFGGSGGSVTIFIENNGLNSGQYGTTGPILTAEGGLTLGDVKIGDGTYGVDRRLVQIANGTEVVTLQSDRSLAIQAAVIGSDSTELSLIAFGTGFDAKGPTSADFNRNQMAVYVALENAPYLSLANTFFAEVAKLGSVEEKAEALDGLMTTVNNASMLVAERGIIRATATIYERLHLLNEVRYADHHPASRGQVPSHGNRLNLSPWFTQIGDFMDQDDSRNSPGFKSKMYGFMLGVDRRYSHDLIIGLGLGGTFASVDSGRYQSGRTNTYMATVYGSYDYDDWTLAANLGIAGSEYMFKRHIFTVASESKVHGASVFGGLELSKMLRFDMVDVMPYASLQLVTLDVGSWRDSSLGLAGGVKVDSGDSSAVLQTFGAKFGKAFTGARGATWTPAVTLGWIHDYGKGRLRSTMTYGGSTPFMIVGAERVRDRGLAGLSTNVAFRRINLFGSYDSEFSGRFSSHTIQAGLNLTF